jgi:putative copper resistance protein D
LLKKASNLKEEVKTKKSNRGSRHDSPRFVFELSHFAFRPSFFSDGLLDPAHVVDDGLPFAWAPKALVYCLGQLAIGLIVTRRLAPAGGGAGTTEFHARLSELALAISALLIVGLCLRVWVQSASAFGTGDAWLPENLRVIAIESRWGHGWRLQALAAIGMLAFAFLMKVGPRAWIGFAISALGLAVVMPLLGHAAGSMPRVALHVLHNLGAAAWLGSVTVMTLVAWRSSPASAIVPAIVRSFSPIALISAALVVTSGLVAAVVYVGSWESLWTPYGRALLLKLSLVSVIGLCGWANWRNVRRQKEPAVRLIAAESIAAVLVLCATAVLTETEHP